MNGSAMEKIMLRGCVVFIIILFSLLAIVSVKTKIYTGDIKGPPEIKVFSCVDCSVYRINVDGVYYLVNSRGGVVKE